MRLSPAGTGEGVVELPSCSTTSRVFLLVVAMAKDLTEPQLEEEGEENEGEKDPVGEDVHQGVHHGAGGLTRCTRCTRCTRNPRLA